MSSLCKYSFITINKNDSSPTPTLRKTLNPCNDLLPVKFLQTANFIKRISLLILPRTPVKASMTVETALVLPLFCFFMIHMGSAIEMMRLHGNLEVALWDAGRLPSFLRYFPVPHHFRYFYLNIIFLNIFVFFLKFS